MPPTYSSGTEKAESRIHVSAAAPRATCAEGFSSLRISYAGGVSLTVVIVIPVAIAITAAVPFAPIPPVPIPRIRTLHFVVVTLG